MRVNSIQPSPLISTASPAPAAKAAPAADAPPADSVQISNTARQLSAAGDPPPSAAPSLAQASSSLNESFNQIEDRLFQRLQAVRNENEYEARKLQHVVQSQQARVGDPVQLPPSQQAPAVPSQPPAPAPSASPDPFAQLASALTQKVAAVENRIEQTIHQSTAAVQRLVGSPTPNKPPAPTRVDPSPSPAPTPVQNTDQPIGALEKLLTANISQFARHMDMSLTGLEHAFMARISAMHQKAGMTAPTDPFAELLNL